MNQALLRHFKIILSGLWSNHLLFGLGLSVFVCVLWVWIVCQLTTCACQCYWLPALLVLRLLTYVVRHLVPVTSNFFPFIVTCVSLSVVRLLCSDLFCFNKALFNPLLNPACSPWHIYFENRVAKSPKGADFIENLMFYCHNWVFQLLTGEPQWIYYLFLVIMVSSTITHWNRRSWPGVSCQNCCPGVWESGRAMSWQRRSQWIIFYLSTSAPSGSLACSTPRCWQT